MSSFEFKLKFMRHASEAVTSQMHLGRDGNPRQLQLFLVTSTQTKLAKCLFRILSFRNSARASFELSLGNVDGIPQLEVLKHIVALCKRNLSHLLVSTTATLHKH